jgi:6-pyruvoyltetrahydropterin/6-carboxytetrahydropterin synthase
MQTTVTKEFTFDAAHYLTKYYGKCEHLHGHTYKLQVTLGGKVQANGLLIDFVILKRIVKKHVLNFLDHKNLNDIFENPTCEHIAQWIWNKLQNIETLLAEELQDPNLDEDIKQYIQNPESRLDKNQQHQVQLQKVQLWETATSFVTIQR